MLVPTPRGGACRVVEDYLRRNRCRRGIKSWGCGLQEGGGDLDIGLTATDSQSVLDSLDHLAFIKSAKDSDTKPPKGWVRVLVAFSPPSPQEGLGSSPTSKHVRVASPGGWLTKCCGS